MNRFCCNLLLWLTGILLVWGGIMLYQWGNGGHALVGGILLILCGPFLCFAAILGWLKARDAENLFGPPISRDDYFAGVAIPYAEIPLTYSLKSLKAKAEQSNDGMLTLRPDSGGKGILQCFPWSEESGQQIRVEVRRRDDVESDTAPNISDEAIIFRASSSGVSSANDCNWEWYGIVSGIRRPLLQDTLWYICGRASAKLKNRRACAVLFCDGHKLRVYPARYMTAVQELLKQMDIS